MEDYEDLLASLEQASNDLNDRILHSNGKWVVAASNHVFLGIGKGINGTGFIVRNPISSSHGVAEFGSQEEAYRHTDPYLVDGKGKYIFNEPVSAVEYYNEELLSAKNTIEIIVKHLKSADKSNQQATDIK